MDAWFLIVVMPMSRRKKITKAQVEALARSVEYMWCVRALAHPSLWRARLLSLYKATNITGVDAFVGGHRDHDLEMLERLMLLAYIWESAE